MAPEWTPPEPSHYERADTALRYIGETFGQAGQGEDPEGGRANTLMILAMVAQARASLAVADGLENVAMQLRYLREDK